jgi:hypothetical protein
LLRIRECTDARGNLVFAVFAKEIPLIRGDPQRNVKYATLSYT